MGQSHAGRDYRRLSSWQPLGAIGCNRDVANVSLAITLLRIYAMSVFGALVSIPIAYVLAPVWYAVHEIPYHIMTFILEASWCFGAVIVLGWLVDDWLPLAADQGQEQGPTWLRRFLDQALSSPMKSAAGYADEPPALSPPRKSLPAPERG